MTRYRGTYTALTLALVLFGGYRSYGASGGDVRVLSSAPGATVVEYTPRYLPVTSRKVGGSEYLRYDFDGARLPASIRPGAPDVFVRSFPLLLGSSLNRVEVLSEEHVDTTGVLLAPSPDIVDAENVPAWSYRPDPSAYSVAGFFPAEVAVLSDVGEVRGSILGNLVIAPLRYDPARKTLRRSTRIVVRITSDGPAAGLHPADPLVAGIAINDRRAAGAAPGPAVAKRSGRLANSVLSQGAWLKVSITEEGIYLLSGQMLINAGVPASTDPGTIRVFGNGGAELPANPLTPVPDDLVEVPAPCQRRRRRGRPRPARRSGLLRGRDTGLEV